MPNFTGQAKQWWWRLRGKSGDSAFLALKLDKAGDDVFLVIASSIATITEKAVFRHAIAFASVRPLTVRYHNGDVYWEQTSNFDEKYFAVNHSQLQVAERGLAQLSIVFRHSNCRSSIVFKVYKGTSEVARVYDYTCGPFTVGISTSYVRTLPVEVNDTLSVNYSGGGTLSTEDSCMDVLLLPATTS
ncbi:unnamed protein product [Phytophthora lilii]|uniref:Unnamed protein product n=1 Tax=Phytophthora lilii TaxID=2077276 RepID=A0A9W6X3Q5_9STRA|nr:unnamed protein product [Phytophthora lilii]